MKFQTQRQSQQDHWTPGLAAYTERLEATYHNHLQDGEEFLGEFMFLQLDGDEPNQKTACRKTASLSRIEQKASLGSHDSLEVPAGESKG